MRSLSNLVAAASEDPGELAAIEAALSRDETIDDVWRPAEGWVAGSQAFPGSDPLPDLARAEGFVIAQGLEELETTGRSWAELASSLARAQDIEALPGDVGLVRCLPHGEATVVRSAAGLVPFYISIAGGLSVIATTMDLMIRYRRQQPRLDALVNGIWASGFDAAPERRTFIEGVHVVGRGETAAINPGGPVSFSSWWHPWERFIPQRSDAHAERLRDALVDTLTSELDPRGANLLALSGGVDSSAIGALAAGTLGIETRALTVLPDASEARERDLRYIRSLTSAVGITDVRMETLDAERRLALLDEPQVPFHVLQPYVCLLRRAHRDRPFDSLVGGEFADHTVGSALTVRDWARHVSPVTLIRERKRLPTGRADARNWLRWRAASLVRRPPVPWPAALPEIVRPELRAEYAEWFRERRRAAAKEAVSLPYLRMFIERDGFLGMHWEVTSALGVRRCFPFVTRRTLELAFECHPAELVGPGTKRLLRKALARDVPPFNLNRPDKGGPGSARASGVHVLPARIPEEARAIFGHLPPASEKLAYWDAYRIRQVVAFANAVRETRERSLWYMGDQ